MPTLYDLLLRFRRLAPPLAELAPPAAPEERRPPLEAEVAGLFEEIDRIDAEAARVEEDAAGEAERRRTAAEHEAESLRRAAGREAEAERARARESRLRSREPQVSGVFAAADREAARIRKQAAERVPDVRAWIVDCVRGAAADRRD